MANDGQHQKVRRVADSDEGSQKELLIAVAKLSLKSSEEMKELQAAVFRTIIVPADSDFATAAKDTTAAFADQTRGKGGKHDLGEPHVHLWSAVVGVALQMAGPESQEILKAHVEEANRRGPKGLLSQVTYARMRFYFSVIPSMAPILDIIMIFLTKIGGQEKHGTAPRSGLERDIQAKLDQLQ
eukprot:s2340_g4.t1